MKAYRIKHIPTGLYYIPSRDVTVRTVVEGEKHTGRSKSNLSPKGKIYPVTPSLKWLGERFWNHTNVHVSTEPLWWHTTGIRVHATLSPVILSEWIIEEI